MGSYRARCAGPTRTAMGTTHSVIAKPVAIGKAVKMLGPKEWLTCWHLRGCRHEISEELMRNLPLEAFDHIANSDVKWVQKLTVPPDLVNSDPGYVVVYYTLETDSLFLGVAGEAQLPEGGGQVVGDLAFTVGFRPLPDRGDPLLYRSVFFPLGRAVQEQKDRLSWTEAKECICRVLDEGTLE